MHKEFKIVPDGDNFKIMEIEQQVSWLEPKETLIATINNSYLINAIYFMKRSEIDNALTELVSALRIAKDVCGNHHDAQQIDVKIENVNKFRKKVDELYTKTKSAL